MWGEMSGIDDWRMVAAKHLAMNVPMQQSCMIYTCIPESKVQLKKRNQKKKEISRFLSRNITDQKSMR